jgi:hypothetical protein
MWPEARPPRKIRRYVMMRFPFAIGYVIRRNRVSILTVAHARRRPIYWQGRLKP